jgi:hypothetical protein
MKKALIYILLPLYFISSSGVVVSLHYCMDRLDSIQLGSNDSETCSKCGMPKGDSNCCKDTIRIVKLASTHTISSTYTADFSIGEAIQSAPSFISSPFFNFRKADAAVANGPPLSEQNAYILHCVFRI